jgi:hypothetical protein
VEVNLNPHVWLSDESVIAVVLIGLRVIKNMEVYSVAFTVAFPVVVWVAPFRTGWIPQLNRGFGPVVPGWTITVIVDNERWIVVPGDVVFIGEAEVLSLSTITVMVQPGTTGPKPRFS